MPPRRAPLALAAAALVGACGDPVPPDRAVEADGPYAAATARYALADAARGRALTVQAWYPADPARAAEAAAGLPIEALEAEPIRATYAGLLAAAPACATRTAHAVVDAPAAAGAFPVVLASHCHACGRLSSSTWAERLATHGFVVLAVDHAGDTLWDHLAGVDANLDADELATRAADVRAVLDQLGAAPPQVAGAADPARVGVIGHSFGAVTAGLVAQQDPRVAAAAALAAPMENPLLPGVAIAALRVPLMFVVAVEDNSITELGNRFIRDNFAAAAGPAYKLELVDAGHWSVSDLDGLTPMFAAGCGEGKRQTDDTAFTYLAPATARAITAAYVTAFFEGALLDSPGARAYLAQGTPAGVVLAAHH